MVLGHKSSQVVDIVIVRLQGLYPIAYERRGQLYIVQNQLPEALASAYDVEVLKVVQMGPAVRLVG